MMSTRGLRSLCSAVVIVVIASDVLTACMTERKETPLYSGMPDSCAKLVAPAMEAIRQYTGVLFSETEEFTGGDNSDPGRSVEICDGRYYASATSWLIDRPFMRQVAFSFALDQNEDPVASSKGFFNALRELDEGRPTSGLGDESFEAFDGIAGRPDNWAITAFRKSNVYVKVSLRGMNTNGEIGGQRDVAPSELQASARAIAQAWADNLGSLLTPS